MRDAGRGLAGGEHGGLDRGSGVVLEDDSIVADLDQVAMLELLRVSDAESVDEEAVVAGAVLEDEVVLGAVAAGPGGRRAVGTLAFDAAVLA